MGLAKLQDQPAFKVGLNLAAKGDMWGQQTWSPVPPISRRPRPFPASRAIWLLLSCLITLGLPVLGGLASQAWCQGSWALSPTQSPGCHLPPVALAPQSCRICWPNLTNGSFWPFLFSCSPAVVWSCWSWNLEVIKFLLEMIGTKISHIWNLKMWYKWTYLQNRVRHRKQTYSYQREKGRVMGYR